MAQAYNHTILPLASTNDKWTQISWGIEDFKYRYMHKPLGMWLPETAVDLETLDILAQNEIEFTILAPWQAKVKNLDVSQPYWVNCFDGRRIIVFFYQQNLSTRISFDPGATANADLFVNEILLPQFKNGNGNNSKDQLLIIASDGETYGHHHPFRDKFLSSLLNRAVKGQESHKSFPALWLQDHPPKEPVEINENTSWSCLHGVKRWSTTCACTLHGEWKQPLREAFNQIAKDIDQVYEEKLTGYELDPWQLRHGYIAVINGQISESKYIRKNIPHSLEDEEVVSIALLLAAQYQRQLMFTSCAWFFDDFDRIEPRNNVKYAAQAVWLTRLATGIDINESAQKWLEPVKSWRTNLSAKTVYDQHVHEIAETPRTAYSEELANRLKNVST